MTRYIYNGVLSERTVGHIKKTAERTPFFVEVSEKFDWPAFLKWADTNLPKHAVAHDDYPGLEPEVRWYPTYGAINPNFKIKFMAFASKEDRQNFIKDFYVAVVHPDPFKIEFEL